MELSKKNIRSILFIIVFTILLIWLVFNTDKVATVGGGLFALISPFIVGMVLAFILNLPMAFIERHIFKKRWKRGESLRPKVKRALAILGSFIFIIGVLVGVGFVVVPEVARIIVTLSERLPGFVQELEDWLATNANREDNFRVIFEFVNNSLADFVERFLNWARDSVTQIATSALNFVTSFAEAILNVVLALIFAIYCLAKKETLGRQVKKVIYAILPERAADSVVSTGSLAISVFSRFVSGQTREAVILGFMFFLGMTILRLPYAVMIGVLTMVTALIPIFGAIFSAGIGALLILVDSPFQALVFLIMAIVIQQLEGDVIYPHVVGAAVGLPSIWTFVAVTIGGAISGIVGMLIAVPLASVLYLLIVAYVNKRLRYRQINPLKLGFTLFDPRPAEGETELARRQRLARIAVGGETHEERIARIQAGEREHAEELASEWEADLETRYALYQEALQERKYRGNMTVEHEGKSRWWHRFRR